MKNKNGNEINFADIKSKFGGVYALDFSSTIKNNLAYTLDQVYSAIESKDIATLMQMSNYFYLASGQYRRMLHHIATLHKFSYIYTPISNSKGFEYKKLAKTMDKVSEYVSNAYIESTCQYIAFETALNGVFYGYERTEDNQNVLQELPPSYCRTNYKINGNYAIEFNFKFFDDNYRDVTLKQQAFDMLPDEFLTLYNEYKNDKGNSKEKNWKLLNPDFTRCHKITYDDTPFLTGVFPDLIDLSEYKEIDKQKNKLELYRVIVQNVPLNKTTGEVDLEQSEVEDLHNATRKSVTNKQVEIITTPCEVTSIDLSNKGQKDTDVISNAVASVFDSAGISQVIFNNSKNNGLAGLKYSVLLDESILDDFIAQCQRWYNYKLSLLTGSIRVEVEFLGVTRNNKLEIVKMFKEQATLGGSVMAMIVASGIPQYKVFSLLDYENNLLKIKDLMIPLKTSYTMTGNDADGLDENKAGKPEAKEDDLADGGTQKDNEVNKNRTQS